MITWSDRIRNLRESGMTLVEIGELVGLSTSSVCDIEQGRSQAPRGDAALKLDALHRERCMARPVAAA